MAVCHKGKTIEISVRAVEAHLDHGDSLGECRDSDSERASKRDGKGNGKGNGKAKGKGKGNEHGNGNGKGRGNGH